MEYIDDIQQDWNAGEEVLWCGRPHPRYYIWSFSMYSDIHRGGASMKRGLYDLFSLGRLFQNPYAAYLILVVGLLVLWYRPVLSSPYREILLGVGGLLLLYLLVVRDLMNYVWQYRTRYFVSNQRIIIEEGGWSRRRIVLWWDEIARVHFEPTTQTEGTLYLIPHVGMLGTWDFKHYMRRHYPSLEQVPDAYFLYKKIQTYLIT